MTVADGDGGGPRVGADAGLAGTSRDSSDSSRSRGRLERISSSDPIVMRRSCRYGGPRVLSAQGPTPGRENGCSKIAEGLTEEYYRDGSGSNGELFQMARKTRRLGIRSSSQRPSGHSTQPWTTRHRR